MSVTTKNNSQFFENSKILPSGQLLDSPEGTQQLSLWCYELAEIMDYMGLQPTMKSFEILAQDLSRLANHKPAWTKKYIHSVYHNKIEASPLIIQTISALAQTIDGTPAGVAGSVWVRVLARPDISEGVLIPANAKEIKCARPGCPVRFIRVHPNQKYHDRECRP